MSAKTLLEEAERLIAEAAGMEPSGAQTTSTAPATTAAPATVTKDPSVQPSLLETNNEAARIGREAEARRNT